MKSHSRNIIIFVIFSALLGAGAGALVWAVLRVMAAGISVVWTVFPDAVGASSGVGRAAYCLAVCVAGGAIIGIFQKKYGIMPESLEKVMFTLKSTGSYPYDRLPALVVAALLPLIFGGSVGPEAGLTGIIAGLCCLIGDGLKYRGMEVRELAEAGMAATLGVIFGSPFFGFANGFERKYGDKDTGDTGKPLVSKKTKTAVYAAGIAGGFGMLTLLGDLFGSGMHIGRFEPEMSISLHNWAWFPAVLAAGIVLGIFYSACSRFSSNIAGRIADRRVLSCVIGGVILSVAGIAVPYAMFSGEEQMSEMMVEWQGISAVMLIIIPFVKTAVTAVCINLGWRGGNIFPVIFSGVTMGYAVTALTGIDPLFGVAVCTAGICGYIMRKPVTVVAVLFLCFPLRAVLPLAAAAFIASRIPVPGPKDLKGASSK